jgi:hypothetical protein
MTYRRRLHPLLWVAVLLLALIGLNAVTIYFWDVNIFVELVDFLMGMGALTMVGLADTGDITDDILEKVNAEREARRASRSRVASFVKWTAAILIVLVLVLYITQPSSVFLYWIGEAIGVLFTAGWWLLRHVGPLALVFLVGILLECKLPFLKYRNMGDTRPVKRCILPRSITVTDGKVISVEGLNGMMYLAELENVVWDGWHISVVNPVRATARDNLTVLLVGQDSDLEAYYDLKKELHAKNLEIEKLRYEHRQQQRADQAALQG